MMTPVEVAASYDRIADQWDSETFNRSNGVAQHRRALTFLGPRKSALDVGCGSSGRLMDLLVAEGFEVEGLDLSAEMIRRARLRHPKALFHHTDVCTWEPLRHYDFITAWDSVWHVPLDRQDAVVRKLCRALSPGGVFLWTMGGLDGPAEKEDAAMGPRMYYGALGIPETLRLVMEAGCVCRHLEYDQWPESHVFMIVQKIGSVLSNIPERSD